MTMDLAYGKTRIDNIQLHGVRNLHTGRFTVTAVTIDGQLLIPTTEFWNDLFSRFHLTDGWAEGKSHARRFEWLSAHCGECVIPYRIEVDEEFNSLLMPRPTQAMSHGPQLPGNATTAAARPVSRIRRHSRGRGRAASAACRTTPADCRPAARRIRKQNRFTIDEAARDRGYERLLKAIGRSR